MSKYDNSADMFHARTSRLRSRRARMLRRDGLAVLGLLLVLALFNMPYFMTSASADSAYNGYGINMESYIKDDGYVLIQIGDNNYTIDDIKSKDLTIPSGAPITVFLDLSEIENVTKDSVLYYDIPSSLITNVEEKAEAPFYEGEQEIGTYAVHTNGRIEIRTTEIGDGTYKLLDGTYFQFAGTISGDRGITPGNNDNIFQFGKTKIELPFKYKNYYGDVNITKEITQYDSLNKRIYYKITVTAPSTNTLNAENVVVQDKLEDTFIKKYVSNNKEYMYCNAGCTRGTSFDIWTGVWTIGTLTPGQSVALIYYVDIKDGYFAMTSDKADIKNTAVVKYNDDGEKSVTVSKCFNSLSIEKSNNNGVLVKDASGNTAIKYTVTVKASEATPDVKVEDVFGTGKEYVTKYSNITIVQAPAGSTYTYSDTDKNLTWTIGNMTANSKAVLTYYAVIDPNMWLLNQDTNNTNTQITTAQITKKIDNTATVLTENVAANKAYVSTEIVKHWLEKNGESVSKGTMVDGIQFERDGIKFVIKANSDENGTLLSNNVTSFSDNLQGQYSYVGKLHLVGYNTSGENKTIQVSKDIPFNKILNADGSGWTLDLTNSEYSNLAGPYYYELTYYVMQIDGAESAVISNSAGIGITSGGKTIKYSANWAGSNAMTFSYTKEYAGGMGDMECKWKTTIKNYIPSGALYHDYLDSGHVNSGMLWFNEENINGITVKHGDEVLTCGTSDLSKDDGDYYVDVTWQTNNPNNVANRPDKWAYEYNIIFKRSISGVTSDNPVTIEYATYCNPDYSGFVNKNGQGNISCTVYNYSTLTMYGITQKYNDWIEYTKKYPISKSVEKEYDPVTREIVWRVYVNIGSSFEGDANLIEILPKELEFVDAKIVQYSESWKAYPNRDFDKRPSENTKLLVDSRTEEVQADGTTKVTIPMTGLYRDELFTARTTDSGMVGILITTRLKEEALLTMTGDELNLTNTVQLEGSEPTVDASAKTVVSVEPLKKTAIYDATTNYGNSLTSYVRYTLTVNPDGTNMLKNSDTITIVDKMSPYINLAVERSDVLKVVNTKTGEDITDQCILEDYTNVESYIDTDNHVFKLTVPDDVPLTVTYYAAVKGYEGQYYSSITNEVYFEGNSSTPGSSNDMPIRVNSLAAGTSVGIDLLIYKNDQYNNAVPGVTFTLYKVKLDSTGKAELDDKGLPVLEAITPPTGGTSYNGSAGTTWAVTTGSDGYAEFADRDLLKSDMYCIIEESAPAGYINEKQRIYLQFTDHTNSGIDTVYGLVGGQVFTVTNIATTAEATIPVVKVIEGEAREGVTKNFSFTMKQVSGDTSWTDVNHSQAFTKDKVTITGTGETKFPTLYYDKEGVYTYELTEDALDNSDGITYFSKDNSVITVTVTVKLDENNQYTTNISFSTDGGASTPLSDTNKPTFNNTYAGLASVTLTGTKYLEGRSVKIKGKEFNFVVTEDGKQVAVGTTQEGTTKESGIVFSTIRYTIKDVGTHNYEISEVAGEDGSITYSTQTIHVTVVVTDNGDGTLSTDVQYPDGDIEFTNHFSFIPPTGLSLKMMPYLILLAILVVVGTVSIVSHRRRFSRHR